jgi:hypothetical protein
MFYYLYHSALLEFKWVQYCYFNYHQLLLADEVSLYVAMRLVSVKFCASSRDYTLEAF